MYSQNATNVTDGNNHSQQKLSDFNSVVIPHISALKRYAQRITNFSEESDDLVQETMLKAFRFFDRFEKGINIKGWLYRIMFNTFINEYRKKRKAPSKIEYESFKVFMII
ncbi:sigma-70 family RNA polymerase sigma factor [Bacteroidota bacterium]